MKPEQLKVIAEGMGYDSVEIREYETGAPSVWVRLPCQSQSTEYRPDTTNNDQMVEIMEKLFDLGWIISKFEDKYLLTLEVVCNISTQFTGKTINEAVCNYAYEYFK